MIKRSTNDESNVQRSKAQNVNYWVENKMIARGH